MRKHAPQSFLAGTWLPACHPDGVTRFGPRCPVWKFPEMFSLRHIFNLSNGPLSLWLPSSHSCQGRAGLRAREAVHLCVRPDPFPPSAPQSLRGVGSPRGAHGSRVLPCSCISEHAVPPRAPPLTPVKPGPPPSSFQCEKQGGCRCC